MNSTRKGRTFEQQVVRRFNEAGLQAKRTRLSGHGLEYADGRVVIGQRYLRFECKKRKDAWREFYSWTGSDQFAVVAADRKEPLVVLRMQTFLEMVKP